MTADVEGAATRVRPFLPDSPALELRPGLWVKLECLQPAGSFKVRGYLAAALAMPEERRRRGLLTVSAGNAAAGCAFAAHTLGVPCRVVMVDSAPAPKVEAVRRWGATPLFLPRERLFDWMGKREWESEPEAFVHPHEDEELAAGHGGLGLELLEQAPDLARIVVPVGGGGLVTGIAAALRGRPEVEVVGAVPAGYPLWPGALTGPPVARPPARTIADGTVAPYNPVMAARLAAAVDRWVAVPEERLRRAVPALARDAHVVAEGAGALAYAALDELEDAGPTAAIVSGGNLDAALLHELLTE